MNPEEDVYPDDTGDAVDTTVPETEEVEVQDTPEPDEEPEPKGGDPESTPDERTVPYGALHEERQKRRELQQRLADLEAQSQERDAKLQERLDKLFVPAEIAPDPDEDPVAALFYEVKGIKESIGNQSKESQERLQRDEQIKQQQQMVMDYHRQAQEFSAKTPDFMDAYRHWTKGWMDELTAGGYSQQEADGILKGEEMRLVERARRMGDNPAELVYTMAQHRGYRKASKANPAETVERLQKGQNAAKSMSGGAPQKRLTVESLAQMSDEEFAALSEKEWRQVMGG